MKKILAVVIAIAMLASMSVVAVAATGTADTETAIEFQAGTGGDDYIPPFGVYDPQDDTAPYGVQENDQWPAWALGLSSWSLDFGIREVPAVANTGIDEVFYSDNGDLDASGTAVSDLLGLAFQVRYNPAGTGATPVPLSGTVEITAEMDFFYVQGETGNAAYRRLQGFDLELTVEGTINSTPGGLSQTDIEDDFELISGAAAVEVAEVNTGWWGWEYSGRLFGEFDGNNIRGGERVVTEITWTMLQTP